MSKRTAEETAQIKNQFNWSVVETEIDTGESYYVALTPEKGTANLVAIFLSERNNDSYFEVEEL